MNSTSAVRSRIGAWCIESDIRSLPVLETQVTEKNAPNIRTAIKEGDRDGCGERGARELI